MSDVLDLGPILARHAAAVQGKWREGRDGNIVCYDKPVFEAIVNEDVCFLDAWPADTDFVIQAHNTDIPALVTEVERLRAENEEQRLELLAEQGANQGGLPGWTPMGASLWNNQHGFWLKMLSAGSIATMRKPGELVWHWEANHYVGDGSPPTVIGRYPTARQAMRAAEAWLAEQAAKRAT